MRLIAALLISAGAGAVIAAVALIGYAIERYGGCTDECHGGLFFGAGLLLLLALALGLVVVGITLLTQTSAHDRMEVDRYLAELRGRVPRD